jgi:hypothetical protein
MPLPHRPRRRPRRAGQTAGPGRAASRAGGSVRPRAPPVARAVYLSTRNTARKAGAGGPRNPPGPGAGADGGQGKSAGPVGRAGASQGDERFAQGSGRPGRRGPLDRGPAPRPGRGCRRQSTPILAARRQKRTPASLILVFPRFPDAGRFPCGRAAVTRPPVWRAPRRSGEPQAAGAAGPPAKREVIRAGRIKRPLIRKPSRQENRCRQFFTVVSSALRLKLRSWRAYVWERLVKRIA